MPLVVMRSVVVQGVMCLVYPRQPIRPSDVYGHFCMVPCQVPLQLLPFQMHDNKRTYFFLDFEHRLWTSSLQAFLNL